MGYASNQSQNLLVILDPSIPIESDSPKRYWFRFNQQAHRCGDSFIGERLETAIHPVFRWRGHPCPLRFKLTRSIFRRLPGLTALIKQDNSLSDESKKLLEAQRLTRSLQSSLPSLSQRILVQSKLSRFPVLTNPHFLLTLQKVVWI